MKAEAEKLQPKEAAEAAKDMKSFVDFLHTFSVFKRRKRRQFRLCLTCHGYLLKGEGPIGFISQIDGRRIVGH